jgi:hypothetical protein
MTYMDFHVVLTQLLEGYAIANPFLEAPTSKGFPSDSLSPPFCLTLSPVECEQISDREKKKSIDHNQSYSFPPLF